MVNKQQELLDELDEARFVAKSYRRGLGIASLCGSMALALLVGGFLIGQWGAFSKADTGGTATGFILVGMAGTIVALAWTCWWVDWHSYDYLNDKRIPFPAAQLRAVERAYRNHIMEQRE